MYLPLTVFVLPANLNIRYSNTIYKINIIVHTINPYSSATIANTLSVCDSGKYDTCLLFPIPNPSIPPEFIAINPLHI